MSCENYDKGYRFSSPVAQKCCIEAVNLAAKATNIRFTAPDKAIAIRNLNIELLQEHMRRIKKESVLQQAHRTIACLRRLNEESQSEGGLL